MYEYDDRYYAVPLVRQKCVRMPSRRASIDNLFQKQFVTEHSLLLTHVDRHAYGLSNLAYRQMGFKSIFIYAILVLTFCIDGFLTYRWF